MLYIANLVRWKGLNTQYWYTQMLLDTYHCLYCLFAILEDAGKAGLRMLQVVLASAFEMQKRLPAHR